MKYKNLVLIKQKGFNVPEFLSIPEDIEFNALGEVFEWFNRIEEAPFITRSSFSMEDGVNRSFAGVFESYYPIYTWEDFMKWYNICINSYKSSKFRSYTEAHKLEILDSVSKNVILQKYIVWDVSWVCFSQYNEKYIYIECVPWINGPFVNGEYLSPFTISIERRNLNKIRVISFFENDFFYTIQDGTIEKVYGNTQFYMEDYFLPYIKDLWEICKELQSIFLYPQDIEFTIYKWKIYILQSRNVTVVI